MSLIARGVADNMSRGSWIRKMFEEGARLKAQYGDKRVHDYTLGGLDQEPSERIIAGLRELVDSPEKGTHTYMHNAGFPWVREIIAGHINEAQKLPEALTANHVVMTCGAAGGLNVIFKAVLNPGDEVLVPAPFFVEYGFYAANHGGTLVTVPTKEDFQLDLEAIEAAITAQTKVILINSPNNPTGAVYSQESLQELQALIARKEAGFGHTILLVSDEPYVKLVYDDVVVPNVLEVFPHSVVITSNSKDLALAGERIGFTAISPQLEEAQELFGAAVFANRTLGYVNAPALMQRLMAGVLDEVVGLEQYAARRELLYKELTGLGFECIKPAGAFYFFPKSPIEDDVAFCQQAQQDLLLMVPGRGFGGPGHVRLAYSMTSVEQINRSLEAFASLARHYGLG